MVPCPEPVGVIDDGLAAVHSQAWYRGQIGHVHRSAPSPPCYQEPAEPLSGAVAAFLDQQGFALYRHQAQTIDAWRSGQDVVLATATSSGKSLAFSCCAAEALLGDARATALFLYPTKALARDQLQQLQDLERALALGAEPAAYDGDTPPSARSRIRNRSRMIVSNPYGLHEYLAQPEAWRGFLAHLSLVVVDEAHRYRGVFGAHVAFVLRRLTRLARRLGADPRFILASGTIANPGEHAGALIGRPVVVVDGDGAPRGARAVALFDAATDPRRSMGLQAAAVVGALVESGLPTICFAGSRTLAELVGRWASEAAPTARISPYRAGYLPDERRRIEEALRRGAIDAVVSTNALELGIDIGGLDAVVLAGYPGTVASTWQQIGRAGRRGREALAVLVAGDDPLGSYILRRPATVFGAPFERAVVARANPSVVLGQVLCAAAEAPLGVDDEARFGPELPQAIADLTAERLLAPVLGGSAFSGTFRPASLVRIDGSRDGSVTIRVEGEAVEVLDRWRAVSQAYPGAVLLHRGEALRVLDLDLVGGVATAERTDGAEYTTSRVTRHYQLAPPQRSRSIGPWLVDSGLADIASRTVGYSLHRGSDVVATASLDLPEQVLRTRALRLSVPYRPSPFDGGFTLAGLHGAEHALIHALALVAMCDRQDVGGLSRLVDPATASSTIVLYDGHEGGSGIVDELYVRLEEVAGLAADMLASCDCEVGCPRCVFDRDCGSANRDLDRVDAQVVLGSLADPSRP